MDVPINHTEFNPIVDDLISEHRVSLNVARLDQVHPDVSGNKIFKLHHFIEDCLASPGKTLLTFGGAWSNHLEATAFFCKEKKIKCIGMVRGERPAVPSATLESCDALGMKLEYITREEYKRSNEPTFLSGLRGKYGDLIIVPEGGYSNKGAKGASLISTLLEKENPTHIVTAVGTATTLAGLLMNKTDQQEIIGVPVIKNMNDIPQRIKYLLGNDVAIPQLFDGYHFGGYAKYEVSLITFMNEFYSSHSVPTDFVYTAKMMYAVTDNIKQGYFPAGSRIVCLHTGGLQGNRSLTPGTLIF